MKSDLSESEKQKVKEVLQGAIGIGLPEIQSNFDSYQNSAFIARPSEFFCLELCGEAGELANIEKKRWRGNTINEAHRADEAADVFISLMNFCNAAGIDLTAAVNAKLDRIVPSDKNTSKGS